MAGSPPRIDLLPEHLIDQIKAGEVIERPGSLVKEILENAVDAGATKLELALRNNGLDLISLRDNGHGMRLADLPLAFCRHATSKISRFEDLYRLSSFGFRGEALASIAAISKVHCVSKTADAEASEIRIEGGEVTFQGHRLTSSGPGGTELVIQDLFYNTPARLKFVQSQQAEKLYLKKVIYSFVFSHPEIEFHLKLDEGDREIIPAHADLPQRLRSLFPKAQGALLRTQRFYENTELELTVFPGNLKGPLKCQYIFINGRYVLDKQLTRVVCNALQATFGTDDFHYFVFFNLPADAIDVNVHPNKTVIKFLESSKLLSLLTSTVKELLPRTPAPPGDRATEAPASLSLDPHGEPAPLIQGRQEYSLEGFFSPHGLPPETRDDLLWIDSFFLLRRDERWTAVKAPKLLAAFCERGLLRDSPSIPLLVSEPFPAKGVAPDRIAELQRAGLELEFLGTETLVLRSIPEWMNGFPLKEVVTRLLRREGFDGISTSRSDWSRATWEEMYASFTPEELLRSRIATDLSAVLREKLG